MDSKEIPIKPLDITAAPGRADGAAGVPEKKWFVAVVNNRSEKKSAEALGRLGVENYVPVQRLARLWKNGRRGVVDHVAIPAVVFVRCDERRRKELAALPFIFRFMTDRARPLTPFGARPPAVVRDYEIWQLRFMLGQSDIPVTISERAYRRGDRVRVRRGSLAGLEGEVVDMKSSRSELVVALESFGCARLMIDTVDLELVR